nr:hypothetical protein [Maliibacterium massiliense]
MARIALIDGPLQPELLRAQVAPPVVLCNMLPGDATDGAPTHATRCAMILERCTTDFTLLPFQIMGRAYEAPAAALADALVRCASLDADIVSMSVGSMKPSDALLLRAPVQALARKGVVLMAALGNKRWFTLPAAFPEVIGVQNDWTQQLAQGGVACLRDDPLGADVVANCALPLPGASLRTSNSFAVPVAAAHVNDLVNRGVRGKAAVMTALAEDAPVWDAAPFVDNAGQRDSAQAACVALISAGPRLGPAVLDALHAQGYEGVGIAWGLPVLDVRFLRAEWLPQDAVGYVKRYAQADLIMAMAAADTTLPGIELVIRVDGDNAHFMLDGAPAGACGASAAYIADKIIRLAA